MYFPYLEKFYLVSMLRKVLPDADEKWAFLPDNFNKKLEFNDKTNGKINWKSGITWIISRQFKVSNDSIIVFPKAIAKKWIFFILK